MWKFCGLEIELGRKPIVNKWCIYGIQDIYFVDSKSNLTKDVETKFRIKEVDKIKKSSRTEACLTRWGCWQDQASCEGKGGILES